MVIFKKNSRNIDLPHIKMEVKPKNFKVLTRTCLEFNPNIVFISGWIDQEYLKIGSIFRNRNIKTIGVSDTPLRKTLRQYIGRWYVKYALKNTFSGFWVSGKKAEALIRFLGWKHVPVYTGFYTCDHQLFYPLRNQIESPSFLFVGRLEKVKGIKILLQAYLLYRKKVKHPWPLSITGTGPLQNQVLETPGIKYLGEMDYHLLPLAYNGASCFILPSQFEPWGMVIHEATSCGLPLILSKHCGAKNQFFQADYNGWLWANGNYQSLSSIMTEVHFTPKAELERMGQKSHHLSLRLTIKTWLDTFAKIRSL